MLDIFLPKISQVLIACYMGLLAYHFWHSGSQRMDCDHQCPLSKAFSLTHLLTVKYYTDSLVHLPHMGYVLFGQLI